MRVLLVSPLPELDPSCGDVTYTQTLLAHPPPNVSYVDYATALADGTLQERGRRRALPGGAGLRERSLLARERVINRARRHGLLFREPFRFFKVVDESYDLIHCHVFHARFEGSSLPVVFSSGTPQPALYRDAFGWGACRVAFASAVDRLLARMTGVHQTSLRLERADAVVCFTEYLKGWLCARGYADDSRTFVIPVGTERGILAVDRPAPDQVIGFVATDFLTKGGDTVLAAHMLARRALPRLRLLIIGSEPRLPSEVLEERAITWIPRVPRATLLSEFFPLMDVFAYPTNCDGSPLVLQEALACGVPAAVSDYDAMPEMVQGDRAGLVSPQRDARALANNILEILGPARREIFRRGARATFEERFEREAAHGRLGDLYQEIVEGRRQGSSSMNRALP